LHSGSQLASNGQSSSEGRVAGLAPFALAFLLLPFARRLRRTGKRLGRMISILLLLAAGAATLAGISGCGPLYGFFGQQQTYTVKMTGTEGSNLSHTSNVTLTVE
jgi:predicted PurR-regulated permease PerM